jgi:hypothetical protein
VAHACAGPSGFTVREIIKLTDADIKSWTDAGACDDSQRPTRTFIIEARPLCSQNPLASPWLHPGFHGPPSQAAVIRQRR